MVISYNSGCVKAHPRDSALAIIVAIILLVQIIESIGVVTNTLFQQLTSNEEFAQTSLQPKYAGPLCVQNVVQKCMRLSLNILRSEDPVIGKY